MTDTEISSPADTAYLTYPGNKLEYSFIFRVGVCVYGRDDISSHRLSNLKIKDLSILCLRIDFDDPASVKLIVSLSTSR